MIVTIEVYREKNTQRDVPQVMGVRECPIKTYMKGMWIEQQQLQKGLLQYTAHKTKTV